MTTRSPRGGPTPPQEEQPSGAYASYVPHDVKYSAEFEDSVMRAVLQSDTSMDGIRVIAYNSNEQPVSGISVHTRDVSLQSLPSISEDELPLLLNDARRIFASPVAGLRLTHPGGYLEGGPGLYPEMDTYPDDFLASHTHASSAEELRRAITDEVDAGVELLKERMTARQRAKEKNEQMEKELRTLMDQHDMELRLHNRMAEEYRKKREARERRRKDREGG